MCGRFRGKFYVYDRFYEISDRFEAALDSAYAIIKEEWGKHEHRVIASTTITQCYRTE